MNQDDINLPPYLNAAYEGDDLFTGDQLRAAVLAEREACAEVADMHDGDEPGEPSNCVWSRCARQIAKNIRARSEK